jgi:cytochrome c oxidase subunit 2
MQRVLAGLLIVLLAFSVVACGDDDDDDDGGADQPTATTATGGAATATTATGGEATATTATGGEMTATTGGGTGGGEGDAANGQALAASNACTGCHTIYGSTGAGPSWKGLYGHEVTMTDGSTVTADDAYITESIHDPSAKIVEGFTDIMPKTFANMSQDDVNDIIAYIKTLE